MTSLKSLIAALLGVTLVGASNGNGQPRMVWNLSASVPIGLYVIDHATPRRDDYVLIQLPPIAAALANHRGYLPAGISLLKKVSGVHEDRVCRHGQQVFINDHAVARASWSDMLRRPMPIWTGCRRLKAGELFLLGGGPDSFDSRYFGPVSATDVVGRATPIHTWLFQRPSFR